METTELAMPKLGSGERFKKLSASLAAKGAKNPDALAAYIGRKKYGAAKFGKLSAHGHANAGLSALLLADGPEPYHKDADETVQCPSCKKYNSPDAKYCDQCGEKLPDSAFASLSGQPRQPLEFAGRMPVANASDIVVSRGTDGTSHIRHRRGGDKIGEIAYVDGQWVSKLDATGSALAPRNHQRTALMELVGTYNRGIATLHRPGSGTASEPLQPRPVQTELMQRYGIPATAAALATPMTSSASGPRTTTSGGGGSDTQPTGLSPRGTAIYKKLRGRGFPHERAMSFARRAQTMGGSK